MIKLIRTDHIWNEIMRETAAKNKPVKPPFKLTVDVEFPAGDVANFEEHLATAIQKALKDHQKPNN